MTQEAKFYLLNYKSIKQGGNFYEYRVKLVDADGVEIRYSITDYYNSRNEITDTRIWPLKTNVELLKLVDNDSRLGKKILTFITNKHFYRGDVIESMFIAGRENRLKKINDELDSFMRINIDNPDDGSYRGR